MKEEKNSGLTRKSLIGLVVAMLLAPMLVAGAVAQAGPAAVANGVLCVNNTVDGPGTGVCWTDPYKNLQDAITAATSGTEIWVKGRTTGGEIIYYPDEGAGQTNNDRTATFQLKDGVGIYGGFDGTETSRTERDFRTNVTVLSGDIDGNDDITDPNGIVTDPENIVGNNSYHVVTSSGVTTTAVLDGFYITAGSASTTTVPHDLGGGLYNDAGHPTLSNLEFIGNRARNGGGMANVNGSSATLTNVAFKSNLCTYNIPSPVCYGGGMITQGSNPTLTNVLFSGNLGDWGAGLANLGGNPLLTNITASGNHATAQGGGLFNLSNTPQIRNSVFWNNRDVTGTGTWSASIFSSGLQYPTISYSLVQGSGGSGDDWVPTVGTDGGHNIDADPRFKASVNPADAPTVSGDLRFPHFSPAIDAGYNDFNDTAKDFWGLARKVDGNDDGTVVIDMGAYEGPEVTLRYIFLPLINR